MTTKIKARKRLNSLRLDEISLVDEPAQKGATFRLMKRAQPASITTGLAPDVAARVNKVLQSQADTLARIAKQAGVEMDDEDDNDEEDAGDDATHPDNRKVQKMSADNDARAAFMAKVTSIQARDGCTGTVAMQKAEREHPALFATMQEQSNTLQINALAKSQVRPAFAKRDEFMSKVSEIQGRDKCAATVAMQKAEKEHGELFAQMQEEGAGA